MYTYSQEIPSAYFVLEIGLSQAIVSYHVVYLLPSDLFIYLYCTLDDNTTIHYRVQIGAHPSSLIDLQCDIKMYVLHKSKPSKLANLYRFLRVQAHKDHINHMINKSNAQTQYGFMGSKRLAHSLPRRNYPICSNTTQSYPVPSISCFLLLHLLSLLFAAYA